jgi:hypothetical protein
MAEPISRDRIALGPSAGAFPTLAEERGVFHVCEARESFARSARQRTKIWEFGTNLHCSIIGTCLATAELRQVLIKIGCQEAATASEHDVHARGVLIAGKPRDGAKLLHKALDRRHRVAISRFDRARTDVAVRALWQEALQHGDIPGAYWAALTHPAANELLVRDAFADVHMLSHLVGAANRADIRRLRRLEAENAELQAKIERQQRQLREAIVARDARIRELGRALETRLEQSRSGAAEGEEEAWTALAADLKSRLSRCDSRRERAERLLAAERVARQAAEQRESALHQELAAVEASLTPADEPGDGADQANRLSGLTILYVGGRQAGIGHLRAMAERRGASFLHHDGGVEERGGLLPGLVSRADAVLLPVDCVSHMAMSLVKRLCRQAGKPFVPLRSAGLAPFFAALKDPAFEAGEG